MGLKTKEDKKTLSSDKTEDKAKDKVVLTPEEQTETETESKSKSDSASDSSCEELSPVWIFGYGSLIWKTNFPYQTKLVGYVKGYVRRFWQASTDHRGTPEKPGRVATLVDDSEGITWGIAYKVNPKDIPEVMAYLNKRESGGYTTQEITFYPHSSQDTASHNTLTVLVYIATCDNPNYLGPQTIESLAQRVTTCQGKSGHNIEYVLELDKAMKEIAPHVVDDHLRELSQKVMELTKDSQIEKREKSEKENDSEKSTIPT